MGHGFAPLKLVVLFFGSSILTMEQYYQKHDTVHFGYCNSVDFSTNFLPEFYRELRNLSIICTIFKV